MSAPGAYRAAAAEKPWAGLERRSNGAVQQLSRTLNSHCVEASDAFEITAHLEALGYNDAEVLAAYGERDHFKLAETLFSLTPRRLELERPVTRRRPALSQQLVMVFTLLVTAGLGFVVAVGAWSPVFWLLLWSQLGAALLNRAHDDLGPAGVRRALSLLLGSGVGGLLVLCFVMPFSLATWTVSLLWLSVAGLLWGGRLRLACAPPLTAALGVCLHLGLGLDPTFVLVGTSLGTLAALAPLLVTPSLESWRWALGEAGALLPFVLYGLGQGCLLLVLLEGAQGAALPGIALFALILFVSEWRLLRLHVLLGRHLWADDDAERYAARARRAVLGYTGFYLLFFVPTFALWVVAGASPYLFHLAGFALFGLVLALGLASLSLGDKTTPAAVFAAGGILLVAGLPFFPGVGLMVAALLLALLLRCRQLGSYGVYLV